MQRVAFLFDKSHSMKCWRLWPSEIVLQSAIFKYAIFKKYNVIFTVKAVNGCTCMCLTEQNTPEISGYGYQDWIFQAILDARSAQVARKILYLASNVSIVHFCIYKRCVPCG
jgi:hypothetical protein